jgi:uncharacterized 2Fe-2S/4Fe-4S cluster protein (DUF4445 family)
MRIQIRGGVSFPAKEGETLLSALASEGVVVSAPCGGRGVCGKCRVQILEGRVRGMPPDSEGAALACSVFPLSDLLIDLVQGESFVANEVEQAAAGEAPRIQHAGVALDIGTTTVSAQLVDLDRATVIDSCSLLNDQRVHGADVMSRIAYAQQGKTGELYALINRQTEKILQGFIQKFSFPKIELLAVAANTTMLHLFANADPSGMGTVPFTPVFLEERRVSGAELDLPVQEVRLLPSASAFFGADIVAGLAVLDVLNAREPVMLLDIGTNGEIGLLHNGRLYCTSTAAGPALEGAEISCGIGGILGAINRVTLVNGKVSWETIGNAPPVGICGAGLVDAVAAMLRLGIIDETGAFQGAAEDCLHITEGISITGRDIRQYQLAKSAICSGITILCQNAALKPAELGCVFISGGLGFFIDGKNAIATGMLPAELEGKIRIAGNTSLQGAVQHLLDAAFPAKCGEILAKCEIIDLAAEPRFMEIFAENMLFQAE